jgi:hypothetical protein
VLEMAINMSLEQSNAEVCIYLVENFPSILTIVKTTKDSSVDFQTLVPSSLPSEMFNEQHSSQATDEFLSETKVCSKVA